jgi:hypothetical protein
MVHKNNRWNISDKRGQEIAHKYIIDILKDSKNTIILLSELVILLNQKTKHIKFTNHNKRKTISHYLTCKYGSITKFLDTYTIYGLMKQNDTIHIKLMESEITYNKSIDQTILHEYKDWILIDEEEFILV